MDKSDIPIAKRQGTDLQAVVPWIISDYMLPRWTSRNPHAALPQEPLNETTLKAVLESRGGGFRWAGKEGTYTKKDPATGLLCSRQQGYLMPRGPLAWDQLLEDCYTNWGKVFRHAHPGYNPGMPLTNTSDACHVATASLQGLFGLLKQC